MKSRSRFSKARRLLLFWTLFIGLGAEVYEVKSTERTEGTLGFWWCGRYGMHKWAMPIEPVTDQLSNYSHVTICAPIWVFSLSAPMRAFCRAAAGKIKEANYILVHHQRSGYQKAANEMDAILGLHRTGFRSIQCREGKFGHETTESSEIYNSIN